MMVCNIEEDLTGELPMQERPYNNSAKGCWYFEPDNEKIKPLRGTFNVNKVCGLCVHYKEKQNGM